MEIDYNLSSIFDFNLVKMDLPVLKRLNPKKYPVVQDLIDKMGKLSAEVLPLAINQSF